MMSYRQFEVALQMLACKMYSETIERMTGKKLPMLNDSERAAVYEAALEVFVQQVLGSFVEQKKLRDNVPGLEAQVRENALELTQSPLVRQLESQMTSFSQLYCFYCESQRARTNPNAQTRSACMTFKELNRMLTDFRVIPKLADCTHVLFLWRLITKRDLDGKYLGIPFAAIGGQHQYSQSKAVNNTLAGLLASKTRADFIVLPQFVEILGLIALESMPHPSPSEQISALFGFLDLSEGNLRVARERSAGVIRFSQ